MSITALTDNKTTKTIVEFSQGTCIGMAARWITWPVEKVFYDYSNPDNTRTYSRLIWDNLQLKTLYKLQTTDFLKAGVGQSIGKSFSNAGVATYVNSSCASSSPVEKGVRMTLLSIPAETILTTSGELNKVLRFNNMNTSVGFTEFKRAIQVTLVRSVWSNSFTFAAVFYAQHLLAPLFSKKNEALAKGLASAIGAFGVQTLVMWSVNFQTYGFKNIHQPFNIIIKGFCNTYPTLQHATQGALGRGVHRSIQWGLTFFAAEKIKQLNTHIASNNTKSL